MPLNVVKTPEDEKKWEKAEAIAASQGNKGNYAYVMGIYKRMNPDHKFKTAASPPPPGSMFTALSHYTDIAGMGQYSTTMTLTFMVNEDGSASLIERGKPSTARENMLSRKEVAELFRRGTGRGLNVNTYLSDPEISRKRLASSQPLMLQPDYGAEEDYHPCQHGGQCQCGGSCKCRVAYRYAKKKKKDPCWDGYKMVGFKENAEGKRVPNCVPDGDED